MHNLATTHGDLGRHEDALRMKEETLAFRRRILPEDHPDIGQSSGQLAITYGDLGRHGDALRMKEETLAFRRRILPEDHPDICQSMNNLAITYGALGRHRCVADEGGNLGFSSTYFARRPSRYCHEHEQLGHHVR